MKPSFFDFFDPETCYDIISRDDPLPVLGSAATFFTFLYDPEMKRFLERRTSDTPPSPALPAGGQAVGRGEGYGERAGRPDEEHSDRGR